MNTFRYYKAVEMEPRGKAKFFTTYLKMTNIEFNKLKDFVNSVLDEIEDDIEIHNNLYEWDSPDDRFPKTGKHKPYSKYEIIKTLANQLNSLKDPTLGLIGRWNRLFIDTEYDFVLKKG